MTKKGILVRAHEDEFYVMSYDRLTKQDREWDQEVIRVPAPLWKAYEQAQATVRDLEAHFAQLPKEYIEGPVDAGGRNPMTKKPVEPNDPRLVCSGVACMPNLSGGVPTTDRRQAVMIMLFPPEHSSATLHTPTSWNLCSGHGTSILHSIAQEIHQSYTSEPLELAPTQNVIKALQEHVDAQREQKP